MPAPPTTLTNGTAASLGDAATFSTASVETTAGRVIVVTVSGRPSTTTTTLAPRISGASVSWLNSGDAVAWADASSVKHVSAVFVGVATGGTGALTVENMDSEAGWEQAAWSVMQYGEGIDTSDPVRQAASQPGFGTSITASLPGAALADHPVHMVGTATGGGYTLVPLPSGWTTIRNQTISGSLSYHSAWRDDAPDEAGIRRSDSGENVLSVAVVELRTGTGESATADHEFTISRPVGV